MAILTQVNERWSMDFVYDQLANGRRFRVLNVIDDFSREMIGQLVMFSISGYQVTRFLNQLIEARGAPNRIICDNGTEFTACLKKNSKPAADPARIKRCALIDIFFALQVGANNPNM